MKALLYQMPIQLGVIALIAVVVYRDATERVKRFGSAPGGVSRETWAAICGLVWIPAIFYLAQRKRQDGGEASPGSSVHHPWWIGTMILAVVWLGSDVSSSNSPAIVQHVTYLVLVAGAWAWATARSGADVTAA